MNVNRRFDRFKQWAGERMGGEVKTNVSDDFKALETEMNVRHEGKQSSVQPVFLDKGLLSACLRDRPYSQVHDRLCQVCLEAQRRRR